MIQDDLLFLCVLEEAKCNNMKSLSSAVHCVCVILLRNERGCELSNGIRNVLALLQNGHDMHSGLLHLELRAEIALRRRGGDAVVALGLQLLEESGVLSR